METNLVLNSAHDRDQAIGRLTTTYQIAWATTTFLPSNTRLKLLPQGIEGKEKPIKIMATHLSSKHQTVLDFYHCYDWANFLSGLKKNNARIYKLKKSLLALRQSDYPLRVDTGLVYNPE